MKKPASLLLSSVIVLASFIPGFAWGPEGHETVGTIAALYIKPQTKQRLAQILKAGETLAGVSNWADSVKERVGQHDADADTDAFLQDQLHNEKNREWHYDDLPLGCASYNTCTGFTPDNDVVHLINICVRTLQGQADPKQPLSPRNALRLLVHFLGDMHQPLHIGAGYINVNGPNHTIEIVTDPVTITRQNLPKDQGGNLLIIDKDRKNLHGFWDFDLVRALMADNKKATSEALGQFLKTSIDPKANWNAQGPVETWAAQWATDSLGVSRDHAYKSVKVTGQRTVTFRRNGQEQSQTVYDVTRASDYDEVNKPVVGEQLTKAGYRLAMLLDAIFAN
jgi:hypothetical protein